MPMDLGMKDISNLGYMHCTTAVSLEMSDEPRISGLLSVSETQDCLHPQEKANGTITAFPSCRCLIYKV